MKKSEALKILGLSEGYTSDEIKQAHRQKIRENHPDRFSDPNEKTAAEERTKLINEARDVLVNRKWEPEYGGARTTNYGPYGGNPYTGYRPGNGSYGYGRPGGSTQGDSNDPFGDWPFETFVWTSWDDSGPRYSWPGGQGSQSGQPGANMGDWFSSVFTRPPEKTPAQEMAESKRELQFVAGIFCAKMALLAICTLLGILPFGVLAYMALTIIFAARYETSGCSKLFIAPVLVILIPIAIAASRVIIAIWPIAVGLCIAAFVYDISLLHRVWSKYRTAKEKASMAQD